MKGFINFIREQGVVGLAIGFILGGAVSATVKSLVEGIINPFIGILLGKFSDLSKFSTTIHGAEVGWGSFLSAVINLIIVGLVVYFGFKALKLDRLDKSKEE